MSLMAPVNTVSEKEACEYLGITQRTMFNWRKRNIGPEYVKISITKVPRYRYFMSDLLKFKTENMGV